MNRQAIASRLREYRGDKSLTKVAEDIGISTSALSMYESGERIPKDDIKQDLAVYYKTTVQALFYAD